MNIKKIIFSTLFVLSFGLFTGIANAGCGKVVVASQKLGIGRTDGRS